MTAYELRTWLEFRRVLFRSWIGWLLVASILPALSQARNLTVVVAETVNGAVRSEERRVGKERRVGWRTAPTKEKASRALNPTETEAPYQPVEQEHRWQIDEE